MSIPFFGSLSTSLTLPGFVPTGKHVCGPLSFYNPRQPSLVSLCATTESIHRIFVVYPPAPAPGRTPPRATRSRVPRSQRLRRRRFAPPLRPPDVFVSRRLPLQTASHPRVGTGNVSRPRLRVGLAIPPPTPTPADGTYCPPMAALRPAPSAPSVSRPIFRVLCRVCIPLSFPAILLLCFQRVACLPNRLASSELSKYTRARPLTLSGRFIRSCALDSFQPGTGPVDPTSLSAPHSAPRPLADTMALDPHECGRDDAARVVRSS